MRKSSFVLSALLSLLALVSVCGTGMAQEGWGGSDGGGLATENAARAASVHATADDPYYTQEFLMEASGVGCYLSGPKFDRYGAYYFVKRNTGGTESYILQNYSDTNKVPFMTIAGAVSLWDVTPDGD
jgi:hypothetical protein